MDDQWYIVEHGQQVGPFSMVELQQRVQQGTLRGDDLVWREGQADWAPAHTIPGLFGPGAAAHADPAAAPHQQTLGAATAFAPAEPAPPTGPIDHDLPCVACGYNLRGLTLDHVCPECGTAVGRSVRGDFLRFADPKWVGQLGVGMNLIVLSIVLGILVGVVAAVVDGSSSGNPGATTTDHPVYLLALLPALIAAVGYWMLTTPEPSASLDPSPLTARPLARVALITAFVAAATGQCLTMLQVELAANAMDVISGITDLVGTVAICVYCRRLALRIPNQSLADQIRIVMWGYAVCLTLLILLAIVGLFELGPSGGSSPAGISGGLAGVLVFGCFAAIGVLTFGIWALVLIIWFRREMAVAADTARGTWARGL